MPRISYYDTFGRIIKEILPYDSSSLPTKEYSYDLDGQAPEKITIISKENNENYTNISFYYDGFGQLVQIKTLIEDNKAVVKNIHYDSQGRVDYEQNPYFEDYTTSYSTPSTTVNKTFYYYDILDRVTKVVNSDGTSKRVVFNQYYLTSRF